jgi:hypothetical protein
MNTYPHLTNVRSALVDKFYALQTHARRDSLFAKLFGQSTHLELFPEEAPEKSPNRKFIGVEDISVEQIVGTLNRSSDFDHKFRPLKSYLRDRWVNVYLTLEKEGWEPIVVHKVGEQYYVEDGHHRVSVARSLGIDFIQAKIWEYPVQKIQAKNCQSAQCPERSSVKEYAMQCQE